MHSMVIRSLALLALTVASTPLKAQVDQTITVDATAPTRPVPHFGERMFGSGRAALTLRESYREDLRLLRGATASGVERSPWTVVRRQSSPLSASI